MTGDSTSTLRSGILQRRRALGEAEREALASEISRRWIRSFTASARKKSANLRVALYRHLPDELALTGIETYFKAEGAKIFYPRIGAGAMEFAEAHSTDTTWEKGLYGIQQPHSASPAVAPELLDLVFMPGVAFGESGERIGMGKGYFDRFLATAPKALRIALAFDFQLHPALEQKPWDQRAHWILTEKREIKLPFAESWLSA